MKLKRRCIFPVFLLFKYVLCLTFVHCTTSGCTFLLLFYCYISIKLYIYTYWHQIFRVQPGICYHLYTKARENTFKEYPTPEIVRTRLDEVILKLKFLQLGKVETFLNEMMNPPDIKTIKMSLNFLENLNAIDSKENLTPLGYQLCQLPVDPRSGIRFYICPMHFNH